MPKSRKKTRIPAGVERAAPVVVKPPLPESNGEEHEVRPVAPPAWLEPGEKIVQTAEPTLRTALSWLTLEVACYALIFVLALALRLSQLNARPLSEHEAATAVGAWSLYQGQTPSGYPSPLLVTLNWLSFVLVGGGDGIARMLPALIGTVIVLLPVLVRRELGKAGALIAAVLLLISPTTTFFARTLDGTEIGVGLALAAVILFWRYSRRSEPRELYIGAALAGLALTASAAAYTVLLGGLVFWGVSWLLERARGRREARVELEGVDLAEGLAPSRAMLARAAGIFGVSYLLAATSLLVNREGLGAGFDLFGVWLGGFTAFGPLTEPLNLLIVYEPLALIFGMAGVVLAFTMLRRARARERVPALLGVVAVVALVWYSLAGVKDPANTVAMVLPLALGAGWFIGHLLERGWQDIRDSGGLASTGYGEAPILIMALVLAALIYLQIVTFLQLGRFSPGIAVIYGLFTGGATPEAATSSVNAAAAALGVITLVLVGVFAGLSVMLVGAGRTANLAAVVILIVLTLVTLRNVAWVAFNPSEVRRELLVPQESVSQIRTLVNDLEWHSQWRYGDGHIIRIAADNALGAVGRWYLRDFKSVTWLDNPRGDDTTQAVLKVSDELPEGQWMGQRYRIGVEWRPTNLNGLDLYKWLFLRTGGSENWQTAQMWLQAEGQ